jgi:hypothetical protein
MSDQDEVHMFHTRRGCSRSLARPFLGVALAFALLCLPARTASACAACGCGDPTLVSLGNEQPKEGRLRASVLMSFRQDDAGTPGLNRTDTMEVRLDHSLSYAPKRWLFLQLTVPLLWRQVSYVNLARDTVFGLGDMEARARFIVWRDRNFAPRHLISTLVGIKFPTAPVQHDGTGNPLSLDAQLGTGSFDPIVGASYSFFSDPFSAYASVTGYIATPGRMDLWAGSSLRATFSGQWQPWRFLGLRAGVDLRADQVTHVEGQVDPDTGGFSAFASPDVVWTPVTDLQVQVGARIPFVQALNGHHREGVYVLSAVVYDIR